MAHNGEMPVVTPADLVGKRVVSEDGALMNVQRRLRLRFGVYPTSVIELVPSGKTIEETLTAIVTGALRKTVEEWVAHDTRELTAETSAHLAPIVDRCIREGSKNFRKDLIAKMGNRGKEFWRAILAEQFNEIGNTYAKFRELDDKPNVPTKIAMTPMLPPHCRMHWHLKSGRTRWDLFCFELPPGPRSIKIFGGFYRLAFPWMCILVAFKNGVFYSFKQNGGNRSAFLIFYRGS